MRRTIFVVFQLIALLFAIQVNSVPTRSYKADEPLQQTLEQLREASGRQNPAGTIEGEDFLDRTLFGKSTSKQPETSPCNEVEEFWKYIGKDTRQHVWDILKSKLLRKKVGFGSQKGHFEILTPFLPPHNFLIPPDSFSPETPEPEEAEVESSPEDTEYLLPSPFTTPEDDLVYPSFSPMPDDSIRRTFPFLATVDNERGEIIYRPWDSVYVVVRRFFEMFKMNEH